MKRTTKDRFLPLPCSRRKILLLNSHQRTSSWKNRSSLTRSRREREQFSWWRVSHRSTLFFSSECRKQNTSNKSTILQQRRTIEEFRNSLTSLGVCNSMKNRRWATNKNLQEQSSSRYPVSWWKFRKTTTFINSWVGGRVIKQTRSRAIEVKQYGKKEKFISPANTVPWFGWLVLLLGLWAVLSDLNVLPMGSWNFWHLLAVLVGIKLVA